jgi:ABC-2 type transport system ATP-binding protein
MKRRLDLASARSSAEGAVPRRTDDWVSIRPRGLTVWDEVRSINSTGTTIFLTTQYLEEADELCERLAIIDAGEIVTEGTPRT